MNLKYALIGLLLVLGCSNTMPPVQSSAIDIHKDTASDSWVISTDKSFIEVCSLLRGKTLPGGFGILKIDEVYYKDEKKLKALWFIPDRIEQNSLTGFSWYIYVESNDDRTKVMIWYKNRWKMMKEEVVDRVVAKVAEYIKNA